MSYLCACPQGAELTDITIPDCIENAGQIQKLIIQRVRDDAGALNTFAIPGSDPTLLASWTPLLAAADSTKVVQTPFINAPTSEPGGPREYGGGNATLGGIPIILGAEPTPFDAQYLRTPQSTIRQIKSLACEAIGIYFVDEFGRIWLLGDGTDTPANYYPVPIYNFFVGDKKFGGLEEPDSNALRFHMKENWSDNLVAITPSDFDALNDLVTP